MTGAYGIVFYRFILYNPLDVGLYEPVVHYELYFRLLFFGSKSLTAKTTRTTHTVELFITPTFISRKEWFPVSVSEVSHTIQCIPNTFGNVPIPVWVFIV